MSDLWVRVPVAFTQAFRNGDIHVGMFALGCYLADESFRNAHTNAGVITVSLTHLGGQFDVGAEAIRQWLHRLKDDGWITFDVRSGQRKPWQIELVRLATSNATSKPTSNATSNPEGGVPLEVTSKPTSKHPSDTEAASPRSERGSRVGTPPTRPPTSRACDEEEKRREERSLVEDDQREQSDAPRSGGRRKLPYVPNLFSYTGCRAVRGTHGMGHKPDPLGTDKPPPGWHHQPPTHEEVARALGLIDDPPLAGKHQDEEPRSNGEAFDPALLGDMNDPRPSSTQTPHPVRGEDAPLEGDD
jgi:hypothetical protein